MLPPFRLSPRILSCASALLAALPLSMASAADPLVIDKDAVRVQPSLEVGANGPQVDEKGATIQGFNGRNYFQDSEKAGALRVGAAWGTPGIYSEKGGVIVGSQSNKIQLRGDVSATSYSGMGAAPVGAIMMWYGAPSTVPEGWVLCDGANGTPDLSGRFIVGYALGDADYSVVGNSGGEKQVTLTIEQMPKHKHTGTTDKDSGVGRGGGSGGDYVIARARHDNGGYWHTHTFTTAEAGGSLPHENRPPYSVLAYIMYKGWSLPRGTYRDSCRRIGKNGNRITAECAQMSGVWQQTELDVAKCKEGGDISNSNGALQCTSN